MIHKIIQNAIISTKPPTPSISYKEILASRPSEAVIPKRNTADFYQSLQGALVGRNTQSGDKILFHQVIHDVIRGCKASFPLEIAHRCQIGPCYTLRIPSPSTEFGVTFHWNGAKWTTPFSSGGSRMGVENFIWVAFDRIQKTLLCES